MGNLPVEGRITQGFGPTNEKLDSGGVNLGIDISVPTGTPVKATLGGTVVSVDYSETGWGTSIKVRDAYGNIHNYGHLSKANVKVGQSITPGQVIALSGNTGASTGPHLSYDVKGTSGEYIDPSAFVGASPGTYAYDNRTTSAPEGTTTSYATNSSRVQELLDELEANAPDATDPDFSAWLYNYTALKQLEEYGDNPNDIEQQKFDNKIAELTSSLSYDTTNLDKAALEIDRFLSGLQESRGRAALIADAQDQAIRYGSPSGKTSFTPSDLGSAFEGMAAVLGNDPNKPLISYTGITNLNPAADLARYDEQFGVTGAIPGVPSLVTQPGQIPTGPSFEQAQPPPWTLPQQWGSDAASSVGSAVGNTFQSIIPNMPFGGGGGSSAPPVPWGMSNPWDNPANQSVVQGDTGIWGMPRGAPPEPAPLPWGR